MKYPLQDLNSTACVLTLLPVPTSYIVSSEQAHWSQRRQNTDFDN